jgi:HEAT repeat protein
MMLVQLLDYQYSRIFAQAYPEPEALTSFLGMFDALTTLVALLVQWFVAPWCLRRWRVQGANLLFPYMLTAVFVGVLLLPTFGTAMAARGTRLGLMPSLRGTTQALILNAVPRKMAARIRSFNIGMAVPVGLWLGACLLVFLKGVTLPLVLPTLGMLISLSFVYFSHRQSAAYGEALLSLLRADKIHLLDLQDDDFRHLDATAVAAISERLQREQSHMRLVTTQAGVSEAQRSDMPGPHEEASLAAIALLRKIGSAEACTVLQQHLPFASPRLTAAALETIAAIGGSAAHDSLRAYLSDAQPPVRLAAFTGLSQLGEPTLHDQAVAFLEDAEAQVRAAALAVILAQPTAPATVRAQQVWHAMLGASDPTTRVAALSIIPAVPDASGLAFVWQALGHTHGAVRLEALHILQQLAVAGRLRQFEPALLAALTDEDMEVREGALQVLAAFGNAEFLEHLLVLLDDDHPRIRESLVRLLKPFGRQAIAPLLTHLQAPHASWRSKETALWALAQLDGVPVAALVPFWERALRDIYQYRLMLACLATQESLPDDTFLRVALQNQHKQLLMLLLHLLAVWVSPEVARLVESGLGDADRYQRAHALEALESLGERRFTRLFLPLLEATEEHPAAWQEVARQQWHLVCPEVRTVIDTCLHATDKWVVIGALLAAHARVTTLGDDWQQHLAQLATSAADTHVQHTAQQLLGYKVVQQYQHLSLTDVMLCLTRIPLYSSLSLEQIYTMARHLTEQVVWPGKTIVHEGEHSDEFYLIVTGKVNIVKGYGETTATLATLSAGDFFGEMAIFERLPRTASAIAVEKSVLLVLSALHFRRLIMQNPAISFGLFREFCARLRRFQDHDWHHAA